MAIKKIVDDLIHSDLPAQHIYNQLATLQPPTNPLGVPHQTLLRYAYQQSLLTTPSITVPHYLNTFITHPATYSKKQLKTALEQRFDIWLSNPDQIRLYFSDVLAFSYATVQQYGMRSSTLEPIMRKIRGQSQLQRRMIHLMDYINSYRTVMRHVRDTTYDYRNFTDHNLDINFITGSLNRTYKHVRLLEECIDKDLNEQARWESRVHKRICFPSKTYLLWHDKLNLQSTKQSLKQMLQTAQLFEQGEPDAKLQQSFRQLSKKRERLLRVQQYENIPFIEQQLRHITQKIKKVRASNNHQHPSQPEQQW